MVPAVFFLCELPVAPRGLILISRRIKTYHKRSFNGPSYLDERKLRMRVGKLIVNLLQGRLQNLLSKVDYLLGFQTRRMRSNRANRALSQLPQS